MITKRQRRQIEKRFDRLVALIAVDYDLDLQSETSLSDLLRRALTQVFGVLF